MDAAAAGEAVLVAHLAELEVSAVVEDGSCKLCAARLTAPSRLPDDVSPQRVAAEAAAAHVAQVMTERLAQSALAHRNAYVAFLVCRRLCSRKLPPLETPSTR